MNSELYQKLWYHAADCSYALGVMHVAIYLLWADMERDNYLHKHDLCKKEYLSKQRKFFDEPNPNIKYLKRLHHWTFNHPFC